MKKQMLLLLVSVSALYTSAQVTPQFTVKAGLSSAGIRGEAASNLNNLLDFTDGMVTTQNRTGFFAGVAVGIPLNEKITLEPGIFYSQKGYELRGELGINGVEFLGANARARLQSDYIDVPVLLKANLGGGLKIFAGPQISYLANSNLKTSAGILGINLFNNTLDASNQFNKWDMGLTGGVSYEFKNGFSVSGAYDHGLTRIDANNSVNGYNTSIKLGVGVRF
jgi:hypothetical protein